MVAAGGENRQGRAQQIEIVAHRVEFAIGRQQIQQLLAAGPPPSPSSPSSSAESPPGEGLETSVPRRGAAQFLDARQPSPRPAEQQIDVRAEQLQPERAHRAPADARCRTGPEF